MHKYENKILNLLEYTEPYVSVHRAGIFFARNAGQAMFSERQYTVRFFPRMLC